MSAPRACIGCGAAGRPMTRGRCQDCRSEAFISDFLWLKETGCGWGEIAQRLRLSPLSIEKRFDRAGRGDLAIAWRAMIGDGGTWTTTGWQGQQAQRCNPGNRRGGSQIVEPGASWHGTAGGYRNHRCRCEECRSAHSQALAEYRRTHRRELVAA